MLMADVYMEEFENAVESARWENVSKAIENSDKLLEAMLSENGEFVAKIPDDIYMENSSILKYNDENSLSCIISLAYYSAKRFYNLIREMPAGKGFADIIL